MEIFEKTGHVPQMESFFFFIKMESFLVLRKYASNIGKACFILLTLDLYDRIHVIMGLYHINNKLIE